MARILVQVVEVIRKKTSCIKRTNWSKLWDSGDGDMVIELGYCRFIFKETRINLQGIIKLLS
jgi:hypothetical protein